MTSGHLAADTRGRGCVAQAVKTLSHRAPRQGQSGRSKWLLHPQRCGVLRTLTPLCVRWA